MIMITVTRGANNCLNYMLKGPGYTMATTVPRVHEKLDAQLIANQVWQAEREMLISDLNAFGTAVTLFHPINAKFRTLG